MNACVGEGTFRELELAFALIDLPWIYYLHEY